MTVDVDLNYGYKPAAVGPGSFLVSATADIQYRIETSKPSDEVRGHLWEADDVPMNAVLLTGETLYINGKGTGIVTDVTGSSGSAASPNSNLSAPNEFGLSHALVEIAAIKGDAAAFKGKSLRKFGRNEGLSDANYETVWLGEGFESHVDDNEIDRISSSNALDLQEVTIEGHTVDASGDFTFVIQTVTLTGQAPVVLGTPLARATRMYNAGSTDFAGTVYVFQDGVTAGGVPTVASTIHLRTTDGANNQSLKCATTISKDDYWIITELFAAVNERNTASVDFRLQIRLKGKVYRTSTVLASTRGVPDRVYLDPPIIVPPNSDVRMIARSSVNNTSVEASIAGYLVQ